MKKTLVYLLIAAAVGLLAYDYLTLRAEARCAHAATLRAGWHQ